MIEGAQIAGLRADLKQLFSRHELYLDDLRLSFDDKGRIWFQGSAESLEESVEEQT